MEVQGRHKTRKGLGMGCGDSGYTHATWYNMAETWPSSLQWLSICYVSINQVLDSEGFFCCFFFLTIIVALKIYFVTASRFPNVAFRITFITPSLPANNIFSLQILALMTQDHNLL